MGPLFSLNKDIVRLIFGEHLCILLFYFIHMSHFMDKPSLNQLKEGREQRHLGYHK